MNALAPLVLAVSFLLLAAFVVAISMASRYKHRELQHRERMTALEKGVALPPILEERLTPPWTPRVYLHRGLVWLFTGFGLMVFLLVMGLTAQREIPVSDRIWRANNAKQNGATDEQVREIMNDRQPRGMPPAAALIALIPMGVGAAYLITFRVERAAER